MKNILDLTRDALISNGLLTVHNSNHEHYLSKQALQLRKKLIVLFGEGVGIGIYNHWYSKMTEWVFSTDTEFLQYNEYGHLSHYHGFAHSLGAAIRTINSFPSTMTDLEMKGLLLGIMYHDDSHSLGYTDDFQNIVRAINPFMTKISCNDHMHLLIEDSIEQRYVPVRAHDFCMSLYTDDNSVSKKDILNAFGSLTRPNKLFEMVIEAIRYTQWPYFQDSFVNLAPCLEHVRRIDLSSSSDDDWYQQIYEGLYYEIVKPSEPGIGFIDFCEGQIQFLRNVQHLYYYESKDTLTANKWRNVWDKMIGRAHATLNMATKVTSL